MDDLDFSLYVTRHGESSANVAVAMGVSVEEMHEELLEDARLTTLGRAQAMLLGERLREIDFAAILASPLTRAVETAHEVAVRQRSKKPVLIVPDLIEVGTNVGYAGRSLATLRSLGFDLQALEDAPKTWVERTGERESEEERLQRAERCVQFLRERYYGGGKAILVVAHGTYNTYFMRAALGLPNENGFNFCQENTNLSKIKYFASGNVRLSYANDTTHLRDLLPGITESL